MTAAEDLELVNGPKSYTVLRSNRGPGGKPVEVVVRTGIVGFDVANAFRNELQKQYGVEHPQHDSWTGDHFLLQLERGDEIKAALQRMRERRCRGEIA